MAKARLGAKLKKWINGDDDQGQEALQGLLYKMNEMKDSYITLRNFRVYERAAINYLSHLVMLINKRKVQNP